MDIFLKDPINNMNDLLPFIEHLFPGKQMVVPMLNKKRMLIYDSNSKAAVALTLKDKGKRIRVKGEPNMKHPTFIALFVFGIFCTIGLLVAMIIIHGTGSEERNRVAAETYELIKNEVGEEY